MAFKRSAVRSRLSPPSKPWKPLVFKAFLRRKYFFPWKIARPTLPATTTCLFCLLCLSDFRWSNMCFHLLYPIMPIPLSTIHASLSLMLRLQHFLLVICRLICRSGIHRVRVVYIPDRLGFRLVVIGISIGAVNCQSRVFPGYEMNYIGHSET